MLTLKDQNNSEQQIRTSFVFEKRHICCVQNLIYVIFFQAVPDPPENLKWRDKSAKGIFLSWEPPKYDGGAPLKGYVVDKCQRGTDKWEPCGDPIPELK